MGGHIVLPVSVCLSAENLTCELNIFLPYYSSYDAHTQYAGSFRQYPTIESHIVKVKVEYQGYISQKMAVLGGISVSFQLIWLVACIWV